MSLSDETRPRQRRFAPKARTGCGTCKSRRVKCGEEKPHCHRCKSTGRLCDGYEAIRLAQTSTDSAGEMLLRWVQRPSETPATDPRESKAIFNFREGLVDSLCSTWDMDVWYRLVLPMSTSEPLIRHALVALGALSRPGDPNEAFGLQHYGLAMKDLQSEIASDVRPARTLILVTCLLFVAIEFVQHGFDQAQFHLSGGLSIVKEMRQDPGVWRGASPSKSDLERLEQLFGRLDNQMSLYTSSRVRLHRAMENGRMACLPAELRFRSIDDAGTLQTLQVAAMRELVVEVESQRFGSNGITVANYMELEAQLGRQVISLDRWHTAMQEFLPGVRHPPEKRLAKLLSMSHLCCRMMVLNALSEGRELYHDRFIAEFEQILVLATELLPSTVVQQCTAQRLFSLETGIVAPLYYTVLKCRDPGLRRRAIACIRLSNSQEGAWDSSRVATLAERVVKVEEQDLDNPQSAADVPEPNRLWRAWFDTRYGANTLFCKRRAWEQSGEWIEYEIRFG